MPAGPESPKLPLSVRSFKASIAREWTLAGSVGTRTLKWATGPRSREPNLEAGHAVFMHGLGEAGRGGDRRCNLGSQSWSHPSEFRRLAMRRRHYLHSCTVPSRPGNSWRGAFLSEEAP